MTTEKKQWVSWEELNALLPDLSPWSIIDFQRIGGLTPGSIPFADASGMLTEDNANLFWDEANARLGIGTPTPAADCALHIEFPAVAVVISRLSAKERPWRQWECIDGDWGLAIGIHANDGRIHLNYDSPIGTRIQSMIVFDGPNARVGIQEDAPEYPLDIGVGTRIQSSLLVTGAVTFDTTLGVTGNTTLSKVIVTGDGEEGLNLTGAESHIHFIGGAGEKGIKYRDTGGDQRYAMRFPNASDVVEVLNRAADGTVEIHANTAVAGDGGDVRVAEFQDDLINFFVNVAITKPTLADDGRGLSSIFTLSADPAKSDGIAFYSEGHIGAITTDGPTYGAGIWLNIDADAILGADVRALDIGIYERGANCTGGNAYGLAIHMDFDITDPPAAIYPFRLNCEVSGATPDALIFAANKAALAVTEGTFPFNNYLKIVVQDGTVYRIPLITEGEGESICLSAELRFYDNGNYVGFEAPALDADQIWVLPSADGDAGDLLRTDGGGNLTWTAAGGATDEKVKVDAAAVAGYLGIAFNDGVLRTGTPLTYADGGNFVTLGVDLSAIKLDDLGAPDDNTDLDFSTAKHGLCPKGTDVGNFLKDDGTWAAGGGGESNTASNQGSGVSVYFQKVGVDLQFNAIKSENNRLAVALDGVTHDVELTLVEGNIDHNALLNTHANPYKLDDLAAPDDNTDLDFSTTKHGLAPKGTDVGDFLKDDGTWDTPVGAAAIDYLDNFEDASIHWSWRTHNTDGDRTIVEAANKLTIAIAPGINYNWWDTMNDAPKIFTGIGRPPCEIITKLITITTNNETRAGIFVASNPIGIGADYAMMLGRRTVGGVESLQVQRLGTGYTAYGGAPFTDLPIWLKIRITADIRYGNHLRFYYSVDGINWTEFADPAGGYSDLLTSDGFVVGLFAQNWSTLAVSAEFDFFKVVPSLGADG